VNSPTILLAELKQQSTTVLMSCRVEERAAQFELFVSAENRPSRSGVFSETLRATVESFNGSGCHSA
jgi:hypothetical protein